MIYSDAEPGLTSNQTQAWLKRQKSIAHNITLRHAPVAERMIRNIKQQIIHAIRGTNKQWWGVVDAVTKDYNEIPGNRNTLMTPNCARKKDKQTSVQSQLVSSRIGDNPQPRIDKGARS